MKTMEVKVHEISLDGLPTEEVLSSSQVAFIFDGCIVSGWPLEEDDNGDVLWEPNTDVSHFTKFYGVTHWIEFPSLP